MNESIKKNKSVYLEKSWIQKPHMENNSLVISPALKFSKYQKFYN